MEKTMTDSQRINIHYLLQSRDVLRGLTDDQRTSLRLSFLPLIVALPLQREAAKLAQ